ncbi:unnamed protein product, partial [Rhizoctonia solani]
LDATEDESGKPDMERGGTAAGLGAVAKEAGEGAVKFLGLGAANELAAGVGAVLEGLLAFAVAILSKATVPETPFEMKEAELNPGRLNLALVEMTSKEAEPEPEKVPMKILKILWSASVKVQERLVGVRVQAVEAVEPLSSVVRVSQAELVVEASQKTLSCS